MTCQPGGCFRCWKAQHRGTPASGSSTATSTQQVSLGLHLVSTGTTEVNLSELTIRYWYTQDNATPQATDCYYANINCSVVTMKVVSLPAPRGSSGTTAYLEVGFNAGAGKLAAGALVEVMGAIHHTNWSTYNETNDYSWRASDVSASTFFDTDLVTIYQNGYLVWGTEP